jgi:hypothetical protein
MTDAIFLSHTDLMLMLFIIAASSGNVPEPTGDSRIDWINMLGWFVVITTNIALAAGIKRRTPPLGEDLTQLRGAIEMRHREHQHLERRIQTLEDHLHSDLGEIKERLKIGDGEFKSRHSEFTEVKTAVAGIDATVRSMKETQHLMQITVNGLLEERRKSRS